MKKNTSYILLSLYSFIFSLVSWLFLLIFRLNYGLRTFTLRNINIDNNIDLGTSEKIEKGIFEYLGKAHGTYLNFESGSLHFLPLISIFIFLIVGIIFAVLALKNKN